jgi:Tol biopolymer transport system component
MLSRMRGGAAIAASLLTLILAAERLEAKPELPRDGRIAFIVGESGDIGPTPRLILMGADGSKPHVRLGWVYHASFSPNGRFLAYDPRTVPPSIRLTAADGRRRDRLLVRDGQGVDWSPAGGSIAFVRGGVDDNSDVWVKDLRSRAERRVVRDGNLPNWSWDGKKLAFVRGNDIWVVDVSGRNARRLIRNATNPRWSPNGRRIAFERGGRLEPYKIYIARADGTAERRVAEGSSPAWSPDGREIAFSDERRIIRIRTDGSHRRVVWGGPQGYCGCRDLDWAR